MKLQEESIVKYSDRHSAFCNLHSNQNCKLYKYGRLQRLSL